MKDQEPTGNTRARGGARPVTWSGLQKRMTFSYVWVTALSMLVLEVIVLTILLLALGPMLLRFVLPLLARQTAQQYALAATIQSQATTLDMRATFLPGQPSTLLPLDGADFTISYNDTAVTRSNPVAFVLLITPDNQVLASSYPLHYPNDSPVVAKLPQRAANIASALQGKASSGADATLNRVVAYAVEPVWGKNRQPIGAVYVQIEEPAFIVVVLSNAQPILQLLVVGTVLSLILTMPIGGVFGLITTRGSIRRINHLVMATTQFADGDYAQRVPVSRHDEIGQLEGQFNRMAEQLVASIAQQHELAEQNARLAERARISRELHDAISQDLFSLRLIAGGLQNALTLDSPLYPQITTVQTMATTMIREMRALLLELRPTQLEHLGLAEALEDSAAAYRSRLGIAVTTDLVTVPLPARTEQAILRITQEALANAARHADATSITLALALQADTITLTIADNGNGFVPDESDTKHGLGLHLMHERVDALHGTIAVEAAPQQGTRIHIRLPREEQV